MSAAAAKRYQDIQVLRALACLMVIFQHLSLSDSIFTRLPGHPTLPFYLGVELFFVISGFVVTRSLFSRVVNPAAFLTRRFFRLTPAIVTFILFSMIVFMMIAALPDQGSAKSLGMIGAAAFLEQSLEVLSGVLINYSDQPLYYFFAMWSLSVEYQFYAAYAVLTAILVAVRLDKPRLKEWLLVIFTVTLVIAYATRIKLVSWPILGVSMPRQFEYFLSWRFEFLLLGSVLAFLTDRYGALQLPRRKLTILYGLAMLSLILLVGMASESPFNTDKPMHDRILLPLAGIGFAFLVALAAGRSNTRTTTNGTYRAVAWLGDRSYAMYLFHFPVMALMWWGATALAPRIFTLHPLWYGLAQAVTTLTITILLADLTYRYVELPWNALGERLSDRIVGASRLPAPGLGAARNVAAE